MTGSSSGPSSGPSWYDVLGVDRSAGDDDIRAAWRAGIADLDPSDPRFRSRSRAAEVLLDAERRAAYDAELGPAEADPDSAGSESEGLDSARPASDAAGPGGLGAAGPRVVPGWLLGVLAVIALAVLAGTLVVWQQPHDRIVTAAGDDGVVEVEESAEQARQVAERAIVPVLSYDYRTLDEDAAAARSYLTDSYWTDDYQPLFAVIQDNAPRTQTAVDVEVVDTGIVRTGEDRVDVLLFVDRPTTNKKNPKQPIVYRDQVTARMVRVDGDWLIDDLVTTPAAA